MTSNIADDSRLKLVLSDVMTKKVYTIRPTNTVFAAAKMMMKYKIGSIAVSDKDSKTKPIGMLTERDIVTRVVAQGKNPSKITVDEIATKPLISAKSSMRITDAMELMAKKNIRRLVIVENNICKGIVTYRDLLRIAPSILEIALEYERIGFGRADEEKMDYTEEEYDADSELENPDLKVGYYCENCGEWNQNVPIYDAEGNPLCDLCRDE